MPSLPTVLCMFRPCSKNETQCPLPGWSVALWTLLEPSNTADRPQLIALLMTGFLGAGLGLFEYMQLCEELETEPIWVINNGISHQEAIPTADIMPWIQDTLDSIEFITGPQNSTWGSVRADMGHAAPWGLRYVAIGNEVGFPAPYQAFCMHDCQRIC